jgi:single-strand DNA-binding protein
MPSLNKVQIIGRLGKDPESRTLPSGKNVASFSVAVDRRWKNGNGEAREATEWFSVEAWGQLGEICRQYLSKGRLVYVEGRLQTDRWQDDAGDPHSRTKVVALMMQILDRKPEDPEAVSSPAPAAEAEIPF